MKIKAWGIRQAVWGADWKDYIYFATKEARDEYYRKHDYCDKLRCCMVDTDESAVFADYAAYEHYLDTRIPW